MLTEPDIPMAGGADAAVFQSTENSANPLVVVPRPRATIEEIKAACAECEAYGQREGYFGRQWDERLITLLLPCFELDTLIAGDPDRLSIAIRQSGLKTTAATRKNSALIALQIAARPRNTAQRKLVSSWAEILNEAHAQNVSVEGFVEWVKERGKERHSAPSKRTAPNGLEHPNQLKLRLTGAEGIIDEVLSLPPAVHAALVDALRAPGLPSERVQRLGTSFLALADTLKLAEGGMVPAEPSLDEESPEPGEADDV